MKNFGRIMGYGDLGVPGIDGLDLTIDFNDKGNVASGIYL